MTMLAEAPRKRILKKKDRSKISVPGNRGIKVTKACTINRPAAELFQYWRRFENLPTFMKHLVSVTQTAPTESRWIADSPGGTVEWDATIINEHPGSLIAWRTLEGSDVAHAGSVRFEPAPGNRGTEVTVNLEYATRTGKLGAILAKLTGEEPAQQIEEDLFRFKALMEAGEIPTTLNQPHGER